MNFNWIVGFLCGIIITSCAGVYYQTLEDSKFRSIVAVCDDNPLRYSGYLASDGTTNKCFRRSSQYPYRINQFVLVGAE